MTINGLKIIKKDSKRDNNDQLSNSIEVMKLQNNEWRQG